MCTVSWLHTGDGYHLLCNRDERHTRKAALAPFVQQQQDVHFIAPVDRDHGGSWIAVNEFGLAFCLLNRYPSESCHNEERREYRSRGLLLMELVDCRDSMEARSRIDRFKLEEFPPFTLAMLAPAEPSLLIHWTGCDALLEYNSDAMPLVSSSFNQRGVGICRKRLFERMVAEQGHINIRGLLDFHSSHWPAPSAYSPCMHREDAATVSFSWIKVGEDGIEFFYLPFAPCFPESANWPAQLRKGGGSGCSKRATLPPPGERAALSPLLTAEGNSDTHWPRWRGMKNSDQTSSLLRYRWRLDSLSKGLSKPCR